MTCYLYALVDPLFPSRARYVGITTNLANRRHVHSVRRHMVNATLREWKASLLDAGRAPRLRVLESFPTVEAAKEREWRIIQRWKRRGACDLNKEGVAMKTFALMCAAKRARKGATQVQRTTVSVSHIAR